MEATHAERRSTYEKIAVGLELEKQALEKECDAMQVKVTAVCRSVVWCRNVLSY